MVEIRRAVKPLLVGPIVAGAMLVAAAAAPAPPPGPITLRVDASEAPRRIFHARLVVPASPGPLTLYYPKWIPGEHAPTGPVTDLAGLRITAGGKVLPWKRDPLDMYAFQVSVPDGAQAVEIELDYLSPPVGGGFTSSASATTRLAVLSWNQVLLYPKGWTSEELTFKPSLRLPERWTYGTALGTSRESSSGVEFAPVPLTTLVDSPVLAGEFFRTIDLSPETPGAHLLHIASDNPAALDVSPERIGAYGRLVAEENALFGARHYRDYRFLLTLSDFTAHFGLEHHESSDNRTFERALVDDDRFVLMAGLLPHEMVHSWNGKYRRPADLTTVDFQQPMQTDLLWVYEGLTTYLGGILTARSGLRSQDQYLQDLALDTAQMKSRTGRTWRPLEDTAVAAQLLYEARRDWANWRRRTDFYPEGALIWLEADVLIRQKTAGKRSLDDFCRRFHGGQGGPPSVKTYTFEDLVAAMNEITPHDWAEFFRSRLDSTSPGPPVGGIEGGGWRLVETAVVPAMLKSNEEVRKTIDVTGSIGLLLEEDGAVVDVVPGLPAARAGLAPSMKLIAVNGRKLSRKGLREAIAATKTSSPPLELLVENAEFFRTYRLDYQGGEKYPKLERDPGKPDLLSEILRPLTTSKAPSVASPK